MKPLALVLLGPGTNRDRDVVEALETAGGEGVIVPVSELPSVDMKSYAMLILPGGFSYGDALGAGALFALDLERRFADEVGAFVASGKPVLGICNGFQALVKSGILPGFSLGIAERDGEPVEREITLARNEKGSFECRWVRLAAPESRSVWTEGLENFACPVAHGEGRIAAASDGSLDRLEKEGLVALVYAGTDGKRAGGSWPANPNGSSRDIAGLCNPAGNVLGLMPHPENAIRPRTRFSSDRGNDAAARMLFENGIRRARSL